MDWLKKRTCRGCGKIAHSVDALGRLQHPSFCPYCGNENPYPTSSLSTALIVAVLLFLGMLTLSLLR